VGGKVSLQTRSQCTVGLSVGRSQSVEISRKAVSKKKRKECIVSPKLSVEPVRVIKDSKAAGQSIYLQEAYTLPKPYPNWILNVVGQLTPLYTSPA